MQIILKLTTACNLNCVYCSGGDCEVQTLPKEIFYKLVDELPPLLSQIDSKDAEFLFHGGEPMLYGRDNLKILIDYARENLRGYNIKFLMQTNGTLIDDTWVKFFKDENISVGISLDGYPELHDKNRRDKNNLPTAEKVLRGLKLLHDSNLNAGTLMVLNSAENVDVDELFNFIYQNNLQPKIHSVIPCGRAKNRKDVAEIYLAWTEILKRLYEKSLAENPPEIIQPLDETLDAILGVATIRECSYNGTCAKNFISVYPDGEVGFCGRDNFARLLTYGNLHDKNLPELYNSVNAQKIRDRQNYLRENDCKGCEDWELCHGGCAFEAVNFFGTINAKYPNCEQRKKFLAWLKSDGLRLLKAALVREKVRKRNLIKDKKSLLKEVDAWRAGDIGT